MGRGALEIIRQVSDKPVKNIIYSHRHYTNGAEAYANDAKNKGVSKVNVYGHPSIDQGLRDVNLTLGPEALTSLVRGLITISCMLIP